jgi:hypothetical protein
LPSIARAAAKAKVVVIRRLWRRHCREAFRLLNPASKDARRAQQTVCFLSALQRSVGRNRDIASLTEF